MNRLNISLGKSLFLALALVLTSGAKADTAPVVAGPAPQPAPNPTLLGGRGVVVYQAILYGPAITSPVSAYQPNIDTGFANTAVPIELRHLFAVGYKLTDKVTLLPTLYVHQYSGSAGVQLGDCYLRLADKSLYASGGLNVAADLRWYLPTSTFSRNSGLNSSFRSTQIVSYDLPNSNWNATWVSYELYGLYDTHQYYVNAPTTSLSNPLSLPQRWTLYVGPNVNYKVLDSFTVGLLYEMATHTYYGLNNFQFIHLDGDTDLEPNVSWDINPYINLNPYINITTGNRVSVDTTSYGFFFTVKLI